MMSDAERVLRAHELRRALEILEFIGQVYSDAERHGQTPEVRTLGAEFSGQVDEASACVRRVLDGLSKEVAEGANEKTCMGTFYRVD